MTTFMVTQPITSSAMSTTPVNTCVLRRVFVAAGAGCQHSTPKTGTSRLDIMKNCSDSQMVGVDTSSMLTGRATSTRCVLVMAYMIQNHIREGLTKLLLISPLMRWNYPYSIEECPVTAFVNSSRPEPTRISLRHLLPKALHWLSDIWARYNLSLSITSHTLYYSIHGNYTMWKRTA